VVTAGVAHRELIDGIEVVVQEPQRHEEEIAYVNATIQAGSDQMEAARPRLLALLHHRTHRLAYKKRTAIAVEIVPPLEQEGHLPQANYAFDTGLLTVKLARCIEGVGQHWVSAGEGSRPIQWQGHWRRVDEGAAGLRSAHPESFRAVRIRGRKGETNQVWAFTKVVRLKRYGRKRLVIVHERVQLDDAPRFLLTDAQHWESGRVMETWSYRWAAEIFHEFGQQVTGLEAAQGRKEEAVTRHFRLRGVAQALVQRGPASGSTADRFAFAQGEGTVGQRVRTRARDALHGLLKLVEPLLAQGRSCTQILEVLMPASSRSPIRL
jgi:hypothetical protein